ncbi:ABC-type transport auxiliary lipoprotein family protein [Nisaea sp.]|uniref:ABC-type transport auxiliary lipoprotein family protein n=1 Tax=Nisaea sp. TaxID=2024842 RepID=UPI0032673217
MSKHDVPILSRRRLLVLTGTVLPAGVISACGILPTPQPPSQLYRLSPKSTFDENIPNVALQLGIEPPLAPAGLNSSQIAVMRGELTMDYFARAKWVDTAPAMVHRLLVESFENSGKIVGVGRSGVGLRSDYELQTELREFQAEYLEGGAVPKIRVRMNCKLVKIPQRIIVASHSFESLRPAPDNRMESIIKSFDLALGNVMKKIVGWTLTRVAEL